MFLGERQFDFLVEVVGMGLLSLIQLSDLNKNI